MRALLQKSGQNVSGPTVENNMSAMLQNLNLDCEYCVVVRQAPYILTAIYQRTLSSKKCPMTVLSMVNISGKTATSTEKMKTKMTATTVPKTIYHRRSTSPATLPP